MFILVERQDGQEVHNLQTGITYYAINIDGEVFVSWLEPNTQTQHRLRKKEAVNFWRQFAKHTGRNADFIHASKMLDFIEPEKQ